jgi:peptide/nickel transport system permease protein
MALLISFASYFLLTNAPGGPLQELAAIQSTGLKLDKGAQERVIKRYDLDLDYLIRFSRWLTGHPRGSLIINGQEYLGAWQVGCTQPGKAVLQFADGTTRETDCLKPVFLRDLESRRITQGILSLDFGVSTAISRERPVWGLIETRLPNTLLLMGISTFLAIAIAIPIGIYSAVKQYSRFDYIVTTVTFFGSGMPTLFLGILGILLFSLLFKDWGLPYLPPNLAVSSRDTQLPLFGLLVSDSLFDHIWHLILPVSVLTFVNLAEWSRFIRSSMLEVMRQDYVRTARAKGLTEWVVIAKHALRNALIPFVTLLAGVLPTLFAGAIITETVFSWPGIGKLFVNALTASDYAVAMAYILIVTFLTLVGYLMSDVLYTVVDPRVKMS